MKFVLDANISGYAVHALKSLGHDVLWLADMRGDKTDTEVLEIARERQSVLVTADPDYGKKFLVEGTAHPAVVRIVGLPPAMQAEALKSLLEFQKSRLVPGAEITGGKNVEEE